MRLDYLDEQPGVTMVAPAMEHPHHVHDFTEAP